MSNSLQFRTKVTQHHDQSETTNLDGKIHQVTFNSSDSPLNEHIFNMFAAEF